MFAPFRVRSLELVIVKVPFVKKCRAGFQLPSEGAATLAGVLMSVTIERRHGTNSHAADRARSARAARAAADLTVFWIALHFAHRHSWARAHPAPRRELPPSPRRAAHRLSRRRPSLMRPRRAPMAPRSA